MDSASFKAWRQAMGWSQAEAARQLDLNKDTIGNYERGVRRDGRPSPIPRTVALACRALYHKLEEWR